MLSTVALMPDPLLRLVTDAWEEIMESTMLIWLFCSCAFALLATSVNGVGGFFATLGVSAVFLPFMF